MAILLIAVFFLLLFLALNITDPGAGKRELLLKAALINGLTVLVLTEVTGFFHLITYWCLFICWFVLATGLTVFVVLRKAESVATIISLRERTRAALSGLSRFEKIMLICLAIIFLLELVQGIANPPNNRDSLTYHLARIPSWIAHRSVDPFPTHIVRQLYQPPLAEYTIMHLNILSRGDYFAASVQFFYQLFALTGITLVAKKANLPRYYQVMALTLAAVIPEVILQSSSTQNDLVAAFFVIALFYFFLKVIKEHSTDNYFFLGLALGLGVMAKGTTYFYAAPILLLLAWFVLAEVFKVRKYKYILYGLIFIVLVPLLINAPEYYRNYSYSGSVLGVDKAESNLYENERMNPKLFIGNMAKDCDINMGIMCIPRITFAANKFIHWLFDTMHINIDDPVINYPKVANIYGIPGDDTYYHGILVATHEDYGANFIPLLLNFFAIILILCQMRKKTNETIGLLTITVILQIIFFCGYLKWQPWGARLETVIFLMGIPLICYACILNNLFSKVVVRFTIPFVLFYGFLMVIFNYSRPYIPCPKIVHGFMITSPSSLFANRYAKVFASNTSIEPYHEYKEINTDIAKYRFSNIGLVMGMNDWEYPLFNDCYKRYMNPVHIFVSNYTRYIPGYETSVDCIVSTTMNKPYMDYKGTRFFNQKPENKVIWYYKHL